MHKKSISEDLSNSFSDVIERVGEKSDRTESDIVERVVTSSGNTESDIVERVISSSVDTEIERQPQNDVMGSDPGSEIIQRKEEAKADPENNSEIEKRNTSSS